MKGKEKQALLFGGVLAVLAIILIYKPFGQNVVVLGSQDLGICPIDAAKTFSPNPDKILVSVQNFGDDAVKQEASRVAKLQTFSNKQFTASSLNSAIKNYIVTYCTSNTDYCNNQRARALDRDLPVALSSNLFAKNDGVYWGDKKVLTGSQMFTTIVADSQNFFEWNGESSEMEFNSIYIGNLYGVDTALGFSCMANYGIDPNLPRKDLISTVTTTTTQQTTTTQIVIFGSTTTTTPSGITGIDFSSPIVPVVVLVGLVAVMLFK